MHPILPEFDDSDVRSRSQAPYVVMSRPAASWVAGLHRWLLADAEAEKGDGSRRRAAERLQVDPGRPGGEKRIDRFPDVIR
jgi:hypothetical protein